MISNLGVIIATPNQNSKVFNAPTSKEILCECYTINMQKADLIQNIEIHSNSACRWSKLIHQRPILPELARLPNPSIMNRRQKKRIKLF